jgi:hypothetical protein
VAEYPILNPESEKSISQESTRALDEAKISERTAQLIADKLSSGETKNREMLGDIGKSLNSIAELLKKSPDETAKSLQEELSKSAEEFSAAYAGPKITPVEAQKLHNSLTEAVVAITKAKSEERLPVGSEQGLLDPAKRFSAIVAGARERAEVGAPTHEERATPSLGVKSRVAGAGRYVGGVAAGAGMYGLGVARKGVAVAKKGIKVIGIDKIAKGIAGLPGKLAGSFGGGFMRKIGMVVGAVVAFRKEIFGLFKDGLEGFASRLWESTKFLGSELLAGVKFLGSELLKGIGALGSKLWDGVKSLPGQFSTAVKGLWDLWTDRSQKELSAAQDKLRSTAEGIEEEKGPVGEAYQEITKAGASAGMGIWAGSVARSDESLGRAAAEAYAGAKEAGKGDREARYASLAAVREQRKKLDEEYRASVASRGSETEQEEVHTSAAVESMMAKWTVPVREGRKTREAIERGAGEQIVAASEREKTTSLGRGVESVSSVDENGMLIFASGHGAE